MIRWARRKFSFNSNPWAISKLAQIFRPSNTSCFPSRTQRGCSTSQKVQSKNFAQAKFTRALHHNVPPATVRTYQPGDKLLVWREKIVENRTGEWLGPYTVIIIHHKTKIAFVQNKPESLYERYNTTQVEPFLALKPAATSYFQTLHRMFLQSLPPFFFKNPPKSALEPRTLLRSSAALVIDHNGVPDVSSPSPPLSVQVTEIIDGAGPRAH